MLLASVSLFPFSGEECMQDCDIPAEGLEPVEVVLDGPSLHY